MIYTVAIINNGDVITGTDYGVAIYPHISKDWITISLEDNPVILVASNGRKIAALSGDIKNNLISNGKIYLIQNNKVEKVISLPKDVIIHTQKCDMIYAEQIYLGTGEGLYSIQTEPGKSQGHLVSLQIPDGSINQLFARNNNILYAASDQALYKKTRFGWQEIHPESGDRSWALDDCRSVAIDSKNRLWFASPQGVGVHTNSQWILYEGKDGLPYNDFTKWPPEKMEMSGSGHIKVSSISMAKPGNTARVNAGYQMIM